MKRIVVTLYRKRESLKVKLSNNLLVAVLQAMLAVLQGYKNEKEIVKSSRNSTGSMSVCNSLWKYSFHNNRG